MQKVSTPKTVNTISNSPQIDSIENSIDKIATVIEERRTNSTEPKTVNAITDADKLASIDTTMKN